MCFCVHHFQLAKEVWDSVWWQAGGGATAAAAGKPQVPVSLQAQVHHPHRQAASSCRLSRSGSSQAINRILSVEGQWQCYRHTMCSGLDPSCFLFMVMVTYGVVPKGLLTFIDSLYKEVTKTTSGTLVYPFKRQITRKCFVPLKNTVSST